MRKLDKKDLRILFELDRNSRQSINELAKKTQLSRDVVNYRMKQLEKEEIIKNYVTIIDYSKFGYRIIRIYLRLQNTTPEIEEQIVNYFLKQKEILTVYKADGDFDYAVGFLVKDLHNYQESWEEFLKKYRTYVASKDFAILLDYILYDRNYLVEKKYHTDTVLSTGSFQPYNYDVKDIELLSYIEVDSRISLLKLAKKLKMTPAGVKYKLRNLEKNKVIRAYKLLMDTRKLGYEYYKVDLQLEDVNIIPSLNQFIIQHPNVIYRDVAVGGSDFEFDCEFKSPNEFYKLMDQIKTLFPKKIRSYFYYKALKIYKYSYFPESLKLNNKLNKHSSNKH